MIRFYYGSGSPFSWRVQLALEEKGLAYEPVLLSFEKGEHKSPEHLARSPHGKVPALADDGVTLYESSAIVEYLDERYPRTPLLPADPAARALVRVEEIEATHYFGDGFGALARQVFFTPAERRDAAAVEAARAEVRKLLEALDARAGKRRGAYVIGETLSRAARCADAVAPRLARAHARAAQLRAELPAALAEEVAQPGSPHARKTSATVVTVASSASVCAKTAST